MKIPTCVQLGALSLSLIGLFSCTFAASGNVDTDADEEARGTRSDAVSAGGWKADKVRGSGGGCRFEADDAGPADAFALANGGDMALVFTRLGEATRRGRGRGRPRTESRCDFAVPLTVPQGVFLSGWEQSVQYGVVKPAGIAAGLAIRSTLAAPRGMSITFPTLERSFERELALDVALDSLASAGTTFGGGADRGQGHRKKWCKRDREIEQELRGSAGTWVQRTPDDRDEAVIIAIDGLDMRVDFQAKLEVCPAQ